MFSKCILQTEKLATLANAQCGNNGNLLSHIFGENFVKITSPLLKKFLIWRVDLTKFFFSDNKNFSFFHTAQCGNYGNLLSLFLAKISWKHTFTTVCCHDFAEKFRQIKVLLKKFTINWFDGKRFAWQWISCFSTLCGIPCTVVWKIAKICLKFFFWKNLKIFPWKQRSNGVL